MLDYRKCSEESYKRAMASKDKDIRRIPREYLYILYTKYKADAVKLRAVDMEKALEARGVNRCIGTSCADGKRNWNSEKFGAWGIC